ncbi:MAG: HAD family hydrolase [Candidatus Tectomicrobia bacterium]|uniref:D,D-heptose 1,7-bisphosphate phosphatase n=1 Tax=Tectimicrobiota bacterium TaxID=2528274 RepID=A0A932M206_UNCTE|nr:HAD family hydrolase [Candidatus Tectomicrobia bacterium]
MVRQAHHERTTTHGNPTTYPFVLSVSKGERWIATQSQRGEGKVVLLPWWRGKRSEEPKVLERAVFLDRDGTINEEVGYITHLEQVRLLPGAAAGIRRLNESGLKVVVITNQAGVARGVHLESFIHEVNGLITAQLRQEGASIDRIYYCPHHPLGEVDSYRRECLCRKPAPGLLLQAAGDLELDLSRSYMVGDRLSDVQMMQSIGGKGILVLTGHGAEEKEVLQSLDVRPDHVAVDLREAVGWILQQCGDGARDDG